MVFPKVIRTYSYETGERSVRFETTTEERVHFRISKKEFVPYYEDYESSLLPPPPPLPPRLVRSFIQQDRILYDPYYNIQNNALCVYVKNSNPKSFFHNVQTITHAEPINVKWRIHRDHHYIQYFVPKHFNNNVDTYFIENNKDYCYIPVLYSSIIYVVVKFKILLRRVRMKRRIRLFLLATVSPSLNCFRGGSHLLIRKGVIDYLTV